MVNRLYFLTTKLDYYPVQIYIFTMQKFHLTETPIKFKRGCLSCGTSMIQPGRRYCSKECRLQILWVLSLAKGLMAVCSTRYAAFSFDNRYVILDILPAWSNDISRFIRMRTAGKKPAEDLKSLILRSGEEWYKIIENKNSKSFASHLLVNKNHNRSINADLIKPDNRQRPRFSKNEKESLKLLELEIKEFISGGQVFMIKSAYRKLAKLHHPDMGGDPEKFRRLNDAHQMMMLWAKNPQFTSRRALVDCWSYDASTNRWAPPL